MATKLMEVGYKYYWW